MLMEVQRGGGPTTNLRALLVRCSHWPGPGRAIRDTLHAAYAEPFRSRGEVPEFQCAVAAYSDEVRVG
jgi:hypothetical protein